MAELILNPNSIYKNSQANFILNKDALYTFTRSVSALNDSIYGMQPTRQQLLSGFELSDIYAVNPLSTNYSLCATLDKLDGNIGLIENNVSALQFFAQRPFVVCDSVADRDQKATNPLAVYLTPVDIESDDSTSAYLSNNHYEWIFVFKDGIKWDDLKTYFEETKYLSAAEAEGDGSWELIGSTSLTDEKIAQLLNDVRENIEDETRRAKESEQALSNSLSSETDFIKSNYLPLSGGTLSSNAFLTFPATGGFKTFIRETLSGYCFKDLPDPVPESEIRWISREDIENWDYAEHGIPPWDDGTLRFYGTKDVDKDGTYVFPSDEEGNRTLATREWTESKIEADVNYEGVDGDTVTVTVDSDHKISATVKDYVSKTEVSTISSAVLSNLTSEAEARVAADEFLSSKIDALSDAVTAEGDSLVAASASDNKITVAATADLTAAVAAVGSAIQTVSGDLYIDATKSDTAVTVSATTKLTAVVHSVETKESNWDAAEANAKDYADTLSTAMHNEIAAEAQARETADTALSNAIDTLSSLVNAASGDEYIDATVEDKTIKVSATDRIKNTVSEVESTSANWNEVSAKANLSDFNILNDSLSNYISKEELSSAVASELSGEFEQYLNDNTYPNTISDLISWTRALHKTLKKLYKE